MTISTKLLHYLVNINTWEEFKSMIIIILLLLGISSKKVPRYFVIELCNVKIQKFCILLHAAI